MASFINSLATAALMTAMAAQAAVSGTDSLRVTYQGPMAAALRSGGAEGLSLASADFNEDGYPDVAAAYGISSGGAVAIHLGTLAAHGGQPFRADADTLMLPERADFLAAGDFDGDGHFDLVAAARGGRALYFLAGDGKGGFAQPKTIELPGVITAFLSADLNRADGLADLAVAVSTPQGAKVLVYESPRGALNAAPETVALSEPATALALGPAKDRAFPDVFARGAHGAFRIAGRDRRLYLPETSRPAAHAKVTRIAANEYPVAPARPGALASLAVRFSGSHGGDRVELHADSTGPKIVHNDGIGYVVNNASGAGDGDVTDGICDTGNATSGFTGLCTLAAAIEQADHNNAAVTITFDPSLTVIQVGSQLPDVTVNAVIDGLAGRTQRMELDGRNATGGEQIYDPSGLSIYGGNSTVTGMTIYGFYTGIKLELLPDNVVENCWIGVDNTGTVPAGRALQYGVLVFSQQNQIGGTATGQGNVIVAPPTYGKGVNIAADNNTVEGNLIGTDPTGEIMLNTTYGVAIGDSNSNTVGGATPGARNVIAGTATSGNCAPCAAILVTSVNAAANNNLIQGNYVGIDASGSTALGNLNLGIYVDGQSATVGGTTAGARNVISGNAAGGAIMDNQYEVLAGNYVGTDATGSNAVPNGQFGVELDGLGAVIGAGNVISGNSGPGILAYGAYHQGATINNNWIGLNAAGTAALPNTGDGIQIPSGASNYGPSITGNVISGNAGNGVNVTSSVVTLQGNWIGTNAAGTQAIANGLDGVTMLVGYTPVIGGSGAGQGNVISGNTGNGVTFNATELANVQGNWIGTDQAGTAAIGNGGYGMRLYNYSYYNTLTQNTVAFNTSAGVAVDTSLFVTIHNNSIFQNAGGGIVLLNGANYSIAAPVLTSASLSGGNLNVSGTVGTVPGAFPVTIDLYSSPVSDSPVEGRQYLGSASVTASGNFSVSIPAATAAVVTATITDELGDTSAFSNAAPVFTGMISITLASPVTGGTASANNSVKLTQTAPAGGITVNLSSTNTNAATVPATVQVLAGNTMASFTVTTYGVAANTQVTIQAAYGADMASAKMVVRPAALQIVTLKPASATGGTTTTANTVRLNGFAPPAGATVMLTSSNSSLVSVPASVTISTNTNSVAFSLSVLEGVSAATPVTISATYLSVTKTATFTVEPSALRAVTLSKSSVKGGAQVPNNTVTLTGLAPAGGITVMLSSNHTAAARVPASVTIPAGSRSATFTIVTSKVTASTPVTITATAESVTKTAQLTVTP